MTFKSSLKRASQIKPTIFNPTGEKIAYDSHRKPEIPVQLIYPLTALSVRSTQRNKKMATQ